MNAQPTTITFCDNRTMKIGDRVRFSSKYGSDGWGTVIGFIETKHDTTIQIDADPDTSWGMYDRWPLRDGGEYNRLSQRGVYGGEVYEVAPGCGGMSPA